MARIAILSNCQGGPLRRLIEACLPGHAAVLVNSTARSGTFHGADAAADALAEHDIIIHQALGEAHGAISDAALSARYPDKTLLRFAYIYNGGVGALGYAPQARRNGYGEVINEAVVIGMIEAGLDRQAISARFAAGEYEPPITERFAADLAEMARREAGLELRLCPFIAAEYRTTQLFLTHNHPTFALSAALLRDVTRVIAPARMAAVEARLRAVPTRIADLPYTGAPISPHDARVHGYRFGYHSDWQRKQRHLIRLVWRTHKLGKPGVPSVLPDLVRLADVGKDVLS